MKYDPAYPAIVSNLSEDGASQVGAHAFQMPGMTMRDYFAAKAMAAQLTATSAERDYADVDWVRDVNGPTIAERLAHMAYRMADAMLAARGTP